MKKYFDIIFICLLGVLFLITLALRVNEIDSKSINNTSVANNYTINLSNYE